MEAVLEPIRSGASARTALEDAVDERGGGATALWFGRSRDDAGQQRQKAFDLVETANAALMSVLEVVGLPDPNGPEWARFVERYAGLVAHAGRCSLKLAARCSGATFERLAQDVPDPEVNGFCLCFATCHKAGEAVAEVAAEVSDRIFSVRANDVMSSSGEWRPALLGQGQANVPAVVKALAPLRYVPAIVTDCPSVVDLPDDQAAAAWGVAMLRALAESP